MRLRGSFSRTGCLTLTTFSTMRSTICSTSTTWAAATAASPPLVPALPSGVALLGHGERLGDLAVVAVDGDGLDAEPPGVDVELLDVFDRDLLGHVDRLGDGAGDERLDRPHHPDVARGSGWVVAHRAGEHRRCARRPGAGRRGSSCSRRCRRRSRSIWSSRVAEAAQRTRDRLVDDRHGAAADQLLHLDQAEVGLDAGGVAVHHQADGAGGRQHRGLGVAHAELLAELARLVPATAGRPRAARPGPAPRRCAAAASRCMSSTRSMCSPFSA